MPFFRYNYSKYINILYRAKNLRLNIFFFAPNYRAKHLRISGLLACRVALQGLVQQSPGVWGQTYKGPREGTGGVLGHGNSRIGRHSKPEVSPHAWSQIG